MPDGSVVKHGRDAYEHWMREHARTVERDGPTDGTADEVLAVQRQAVDMVLQRRRSPRGQE